MNLRKLILSEDLSLYDSCIQSINLYKNGKENISAEVYIKLIYPQKTYLNIIFDDIINFSFIWNNNYDFYFLDSYKLFKTDDFYYCSFDPVNSEMEISADDKDVIISKDINCYCFNKESNSCISLKFKELY